MSGHSKWHEIKHKGTPATLDAARAELADGLAGERVLTEDELAAALVHTYGMTSGRAAEVAPAHHGKLPTDAETISAGDVDPETVWRR